MPNDPQPPADPILSLRDLNLERGGNRLLDRIDADFEAGRIHAVVGPNGAGKSTLASVIMGREEYRALERGRILHRGEDITDLDITERARRGITLAWQEPARFEGLRIGRLLAASAARAGGDDDPASLDRILADTGLEPERYRDRAADRTLSGGERKKLELATIMAMRPSFVMLDEPDSGIDVASLEHIFAALATLRDRGATVVLITHSPAVLAHAEDALLMCCGQIVDRGDAGRIGEEFRSGCIPCDHHPRQIALAMEGRSA
jgi:Fe-S cluster assembly ATP-binding protein